MKTVIVDERISEKSKSYLIKLGFSVITLPPSDKLPQAICSHTDILTFATEDRIILCREYANENPSLLLKLKSELKNIDIQLSSDSFSKEYPSDAIFNALIIGDYIFCKAATVSRDVLEYANERGLSVVNVNQGYPACTVLKLSESIAVTADCGMQKALTACGIKVYMIENSDSIKLPPYPYGFIGGVAGVFDGQVFFSGDLQFHPNCDIIKEAATLAGLECVSLAEGEPLLDVGRLVFYDDSVDYNCGNG